MLNKCMPNSKGKSDRRCRLEWMQHVLIVGLKEISYKKLTESSEIALISVNSLIDVLEILCKVKLSGKRWRSFRSMLYMTALNLVVIFATMRSASI